MTDSVIVGHTKQLEDLAKISKNPSNCSQNVFLFQGPKGSGKALIAKKFANTISNPKDVTFFTYDGSQNIDEFREVFASMGFTALNGKCKSYIFNITKPLKPLIANALLKSLEEPLASINIILVVPEVSFILKTITSRAKVINFAKLTDSEAYQVLLNKGYSEEQATNLIYSFGTDLEILTSKPYEELIEIRDYIYKEIPELSPYHFIEIWNIAYWIDTDFETYLAVIIKWAAQYMSDPEWSPRFSALVRALTDVYNNNPPNRSEFLERAILIYLGWPLPPVITPYGEFK